MEFYYTVMKRKTTLRKKQELTEQEATEMWQMWRSGAFHLKEIANHFNVSELTVNQVIKVVQGWYNYGIK